MAKRSKKTLIIENTILNTSIRLFMENGYTDTTLRKIADEADLTTSSVYNIFNSKEEIASRLIEYVILFQNKFIEEKVVSDNKIVKYMAERVLQIYLAEYNDYLKEMYIVSYTLPLIIEKIYEQVTKEIINIFINDLVDYKESDFYEKEIAIAGIMRGFLAAECNPYFTIENKVKAFMKNSLLVLEVNKQEIDRIIAEVMNINFEALSKESAEKLLMFIQNELNKEEIN